MDEINDGTGGAVGIAGLFAIDLREVLAEATGGVGVIGKGMGGTRHGTSDEIGPEGAGFDEGDADAEGFEFLGEGFAEAGEGGFGGAVETEAGVIGDGGGGAHLDDVTGAVLAEVWQKGAEDGDGPEEVGFEGGAGFGVIAFLHSPKETDAGIVDEDIDATPMGDGGWNGGGDGVGLGDVKG